VVSAPQHGDKHRDLPLSAIFDHQEDARVPHAEVWSQVLDRCAQQLPTIFTHNTNLDVHYGRRCLTMRNIKDETIYDPARYDRHALRAELGFGPKDRIILFGGLVRRHKGIFELAEFVRKLGSPYRLLVVGSRDTPDLRTLTSQQRKAMAVLPPQAPERMAALNAAADIVVLWLDPAVPASHFQSPYKMTDALAMGPAIIASPIGDFPAMAERRLLWTVPFGDFSGLGRTIREVFADEGERRRRQARARRLFLREYSYNAVAPAFALAARRLTEPRETYPLQRSSQQ
jgi:glycosyltransferase involved in cell wall biosynthesis